MKRALPHGSVTVPDAWADVSIFQFASPPRDDLAVPLVAAKGQRVQPPPAAVAIARLALRQGQTIEHVITEMTAAMPTERLDEPDWVHPALGVVRTVSFRHGGDGVPVRQAVAFFPWPDGKTVTTLTCSAEASAWERHLPSFRSTFESFALPEPTITHGR